MSDYLSLRKEVEERVGREEFKKIMKELGYMLFYYGFGAYLPRSLQKKVFGENLKKYDAFESTFINSCVFIGSSIPLLFSGDITLSYQAVINRVYTVGFSIHIPAYFLKGLGLYFLITNSLRVLYAYIKKKRIGDILLEGIEYIRKGAPRMIAKYFIQDYEKKVEENLKKTVLVERKRKELEKKIRKVKEEIQKANEEYFKRRYRKDET